MSDVWQRFQRVGRHARLIFSDIADCRFGLGLEVKKCTSVSHTSLDSRLPMYDRNVPQGLESCRLMRRIFVRSDAPRPGQKDRIEEIGCHSPFDSCLIRFRWLYSSANSPYSKKYAARAVTRRGVLD